MNVQSYYIQKTKLLSSSEGEWKDINESSSASPLGTLYRYRYINNNIGWTEAAREDGASHVHEDRKSHMSSPYRTRVQRRKGRWVRYGQECTSRSSSPARTPRPQAEKIHRPSYRASLLYAVICVFTAQNDSLGLSEGLYASVRMTGAVLTSRCTST